MNDNAAAFSIETPGRDGEPVAWFDTAGEAMKAVNRLRALRSTGFVIRDRAGNQLTDQQLAVIVMEERRKKAAPMRERPEV